MKILITGGRSLIAFELANCFLNFGHEVHIADVFKPYIWRKLKNKIHFHNYPSPNLKNKEFRKWVVEFYENIKPDLIIPINEEIFYWAKICNKNNIPIIAPKFEDLIMLHSKFEFNKMILSLGLNAPKTQIAKPNMMGENMVFKREFSRFGESILIKPKIASFLEIKNNPMLAQEYIEGVDYSFYSLVCNHQILLFSAYKSNWRTKGGAAICFETIDIDIAIAAKNIAQKIGQKIDGFVQISCDFRIDKNGKIWLIECNPRATSGIHNIIYDWSKINSAFIEKKPQEIIPKGAKIGIAMIVYGFFTALKNNEIGKFIKDYKSHRDCLKNVQIYSFFDALKYMIGARQNNMTLSQFLTHDIEYNGEIDEI